MLKKESGFTLIEMLIVLMVISILMILIIPNIGSKSQDVQSKGCDALISVVQTQVDAYRLDHGQLPGSLNALEQDGYITKDQLTCADETTLELEDGKVNAPS